MIKKNKHETRPVPEMVGKPHFIVLFLSFTFAQVHYASVDHIPQEGDDSGVFLQYTEQVESIYLNKKFCRLLNWIQRYEQEKSCRRLNWFK